MSEPRIDVVLPFYGDLERLRIAVASVLAQDCQDFRLICVDDRSPDPTAGEWVRGLSDHRVTYVRNPRNLGLAANFDRCVDLVTAPWFVMMGADDVMLPQYMETVLGLVSQAPHVAMVQPGVSVIDEHGAPYKPLADRVKAVLRPATHGRPRELKGKTLAQSLTRADWAYFPSITWRADYVKKHRFDQRYPIALDLALMLNIILDGGSMLLDDRVVFEYRRHRSSESAVTATNGTRFEQEIALFTAYQGRFKAAGWRLASWEAQAHVVTRLNAAIEALGAAKAGHFPRAARLASFVLR